MTRSVEIRCLAPQRRDALEESARLALAFVSVCSRPDRRADWRQDKLRLTLSSTALHDGCYLAESAQRLLEAVCAFGVPVCRHECESDPPPPAEWSQWWSDLRSADEQSFDLVLEIL